MNDKKNRKSLIYAFIVLLLTLCTFMGSTLAWFTATTTNNNNKVVSGSLKIDLAQRYDTLSAEQLAVYTTATDDKEFVSLKEEPLYSVPVFNYDLWEPGFSDYKVLKVENTGKLALKYKLEIVPVNEG